MNNIFINRESIISSKRRMSGINIQYKNKLNLDRKEQIILESRLFNLSYPKYLNKLKKYGAFLIKKSNFIDYYFLDNNKMNEHLRKLNLRIIELFS